MLDCPTTLAFAVNARVFQKAHDGVFRMCRDVFDLVAGSWPGLSNRKVFVQWCMIELSEDGFGLLVLLLAWGGGQVCLFSVIVCWSVFGPSASVRPQFIHDVLHPACLKTSTKCGPRCACRLVL